MTLGRIFFYWPPFPHLESKGVVFGDPKAPCQLFSSSPNQYLFCIPCGHWLVRWTGGRSRAGRGRESAALCTQCFPNWGSCSGGHRGPTQMEQLDNFWSELGTGLIFNTFSVAVAIHLLVWTQHFSSRCVLSASVNPRCTPCLLWAHLQPTPCTTELWEALCNVTRPALPGSPKDSDWYFQEFCSIPEAFALSSEYEKWERRVSRKETKTLGSMKWLQIRWRGVFKETREVVAHTLYTISRQQLKSSEALCETGTNLCPLGTMTITFPSTKQTKGCLLHCMPSTSPSKVRNHPHPCPRGGHS